MDLQSHKKNILLTSIEIQRLPVQNQSSLFMKEKWETIQFTT